MIVVNTNRVPTEREELESMELSASLEAAALELSEMNRSYDETRRAMGLCVALEELADVVRDMDTPSMESRRLVEVASMMGAAGSGVRHDDLIPALDAVDPSVSTESYVELAKKIWATIWTAIQKAYRAFKAWASETFSQMAKIRKAAAALRDRANAASKYSTTRSEVEIRPGQVAARLTVNRAIPRTATDLTIALSKHREVVRLLLRSWLDDLANVGTTVQRGISKTNLRSPDVDLRAINAMVDELDFEKVGKWLAGPNATTAEYIGGVKFDIVNPVTISGANELVKADDIQSRAVTLMTTTDRLDQIGGIMEVATISEIMAICDLVMDITLDFESYSSGARRRQLDKLIEDMGKAAGEMAKEFDALGEAEKPLAEAYRSAISNYVSTFTEWTKTPFKDLLLYSAHTLRAAIVLMHEMLDTYEPNVA